jgi:hypothetical protein
MEGCIVLCNDRASGKSGVEGSCPRVERMDLGRKDSEDALSKPVAKIIAEMLSSISVDEGVSTMTDVWSSARDFTRPRDILIAPD